MLKQFGMNIVYTLLVAAVLMTMDKAYALINHYFIYHFTFREFFYKLVPVVVMISIIPKYRFRFLFLSLAVLASFFQYVHFSYFGRNITMMEFGLIAGNGGEIFDAIESMKGMFVVPLLIASGGMITVWMLEKYFAGKLFRYAKWYWILGGFFLFLELQINYVLHIKLKDHTQAIRNSESKLLYPVYNRHSSRNFFVVLNYYIWSIMPKQLLHAGEMQDDSVVPPKLIDNDADATIVLVIGESLRADKFTLKNNALTPMLQKLQNDPNLFANTIFSAGTITKVSISAMINYTNTPNPMPLIFSQVNNIFKLAKDAGFKTSFISAQRSDQLKIIRDFLGLKYIDLYMSRDDFSTHIKPGGYDNDLLTILKKLHLIEPKSFIVLQMRGSHTPYGKDYPDSFAKTKSDYDNSVLFTDSVIFNLIDLIKSSTDGNFIFLFASDHGELLGERGKRGHGQLESEVYHVPFVGYAKLKNEDQIAKSIKDIKCHYDMVSVILKAMGYDVSIDFNRDRNITILNADLEKLSGYGIVQIKNGKLRAIDKRMQD